MGAAASGYTGYQYRGAERKSEMASKDPSPGWARLLPVVLFVLLIASQDHPRPGR